MPVIQFVNHASILIESDDHVLLVDPWLEGTAFNDGWALLDQSTSNAAMVETLVCIGKPLTIWYSHEHSDHFSISFLRFLQSAHILSVRIVYQYTLDHRVVRHLQRTGWCVIEARSGLTYRLGSQISITIWSFLETGDSFALIDVHGIKILNLNDCAVNTEQKCDHVLSSLGIEAKKVDILLTQFGYANWIGNETDIQLRRDAASEKLQRIALQARLIEPVKIIPFASFVYFCHEENDYLNDEQNSVARLISDPLLQEYRNRLLVLMPGDKLDTSALPAGEDQRAITERAIAYWLSLLKNRQHVLHLKEPPVAFQRLQSAANKFRNSISKNMLWINWLLEATGVIQPLNILVTDDGGVLSLSYINGLRRSAESNFNISCTSNVFLYILSNDFGFNTIVINGRFRSGGSDHYRRTLRFFVLQDYKKMGFGVTSPVATAMFISRRMKNIFLHMTIGFWRTLSRSSRR